nr:MAG TPA: hypothetical protein [Caudoviricetes sp.]
MVGGSFLWLVAPRVPGWGGACQAGGGSISGGVLQIRQLTRREISTLTI